MSLTTERVQLADPWEGDPEGEEDGFDPETRRLRLSLPLPPPDNQCHRSGQFSRYATAAYRDWLSLAARRLREILGPWPADGEEWWGVEVWLWMGSRSDGPNHLKPLLDLLGGSYVPEKGERGPDGKLLDRDKIQKTQRGLFLNDKRIRWAIPNVLATRCEEPRCVLVAFPVPAPVDEAAEAKERERQEKLQAKFDAEREREGRRFLLALEKARKTEEAQRQAAQVDREIVEFLHAYNVGATIPGNRMAEVLAGWSVSKERVRRVWKAHREAGAA